MFRRIRSSRMLRPSELPRCASLGREKSAQLTNLEVVIDDALKKSTPRSGKYDVVVPGTEILEDAALGIMLQDRYGPYWRVRVAGPTTIGDGDEKRLATLLHFFPMVE